MKEFNNPLAEHAYKSYQEEIEEDIYLTVNEYEPFKEISRSWESELSLELEDGLTMNITIFTYKEKDFEKMIKDAKKIIKKLNK